MDNAAKIKYQKKNKHNKTDPPRDARIDAHLNLKGVSRTRARRQTDRRTDRRTSETWIMPCHVRRRSGMTGGAALVRKCDVA
jgi:hypothetical protein